ncbi:MAG: hypothetical protein Q8927_12625 [Bacteroidota bacterium]|nr:hypothetical protein [Bacteroidota bacterium]MDP4248110.1 hypothetical protein [Bacteroidota bacterium]MDP4252506.1 hypothetical protein [Bacteroidota bacterium]
MIKILSFALLLLISSSVVGQAVGRVNKKTKEFSILPDLKVEYTVFGYEYANTTTRKMIAFSSSINVVRGSTCPLGAYFDTDKMKPGDKIVYVGPVGPFGRMNFIASNGKKTMIYIPKTSFVIK